MHYLIYFLLFFLTSCQVSSHYQETKKWMETTDKPKVLCTIGMIEDLVKQIGKEHIATLTLIKGDLDPHSYQLVKGDDEKLSAADVIFFNGLGLEHGPSLQNYLSISSKAVGLGNQIYKENPTSILSIQGQTDPHIWMDVSLWKKTIPYIVKTLSEYDPRYAKEFAENGKELEIKMEEKDRQIKRLMGSVPEKKRYLVTSHDAFNYFARAYLVVDGDDDWDIRCTAPEGLAPESQLSTTDIQEIIDHCKKYDIRVIFPESNVSKDSIRKIVSAGREKGLDLRMSDMVLYADAMGPKGSDGDTYLKMIDYNAHVIAKCLLEN